MTTQENEDWTEPACLENAPDDVLLGLLMVLVSRKAGKRVQIAKAELDSMAKLYSDSLKMRMSDKLEMVEIFLDDDGHAD